METFFATYVTKSITTPDPSGTPMTNVRFHPDYILGSKLQCPNWSKALADLKDLLGTWTMLSWKKEIIATGQIVDALGPDPVGYITYAADGRMHAIVVRGDRLAPETLPPTATEKLHLFDSMLAYSGTYTLDDEKVIHHVDVSWNQALDCLDTVLQSGQRRFDDYGRARNRSLFGKRSDPSHGISEGLTHVSWRHSMSAFRGKADIGWRPFNVRS